MQQYSPNGFSRPRYVKDVMEKLLKRGGATITALGLLIIGALIAGCGSGGGSGDGAGVSPQVVSGVAATGAFGRTGNPQGFLLRTKRQGNRYRQRWLIRHRCG